MVYRPITNDDANQSSAPASPLLMLWHFSPNKAKRKVFTPNDAKVSKGPSTVLVTNRPPGNGRRLDSSRESYSTSWPLVPDLSIQRTIINFNIRCCQTLPTATSKGGLNGCHLGRAKSCNTTHTFPQSPARFLSDRLALLPVQVVKPTKDTKRHCCPSVHHTSRSDYT